jgi:hypothetical protein
MSRRIKAVMIVGGQEDMIIDVVAEMARARRVTV